MRSGGQHSLPAQRLAAVALALLACLPAAPATAQVEPLAFVTEGLPAAVKGQPYQTGETPTAVFLEATGGSPPYTFELRDGELPEGMSLESNGALLGTPARCSNAVFQVMVRDAATEWALRTFLLVVEGEPELQLPTTFDPVVEAGDAVTLGLDLTNQGCTTVRVSAETLDFGPVLPEAAAPRSELAALLAMGAPVPRTLGRRAGPLRPRAEGWALDDSGRLLDGEGNPAGLQPVPISEGLQLPEAAGASILYTNRSNTRGEVDRLRRLGYTVVETLVPQALDLQTLLAFDLLWLTAATDAIFPSREAVRQFVWQGGGLVVEQVQFSGSPGFLPAGYELDALTTPAPNNRNVHQLTPEAVSDPLTSTLTPEDLPTNFDTTLVSGSGPRWTWLALQEDTPALGTLAVAELGAGRIVYFTGNLGEFISPQGTNGSDDFVARLVDRADDGGTEVSCSWLEPGRGVSDVRLSQRFVDDVQPFDNTGETVALQLTVDTGSLLPGSYSCRLHLITSDPENLEPTVAVNLTVTEPAGPRILTSSLPAARPGSPYGATLLTAGGTPPYSYSLIGGALPDGIVLDAAAGTLFGTPTESGLFKPVFQVADSSGPPAVQSAAELTLTSGLVITTESLPDAVIGQIYTVPIDATGGTPPYTFSREDRTDYNLPAADPNSPDALACPTTDLGGGSRRTTCTLAEASYRLFFAPLDGFFTPPAMDVPVVAGGMAAVDGHYTPYATLVVETNLDQALYSVQASTPFGDVDLLGVGTSTTFSELPPGEYSIAFGVVAGFATPAEASLTLAEGATATVTASYVDITVPPPAAIIANPGLEPRVSTPPATAPPAAEADIGFGSGVLVVDTNAEGAGFRLLANRPVSELLLYEPGGGFGESAALVGRMATLSTPTLAPGEKVSITLLVEDSAGNRARRSYAPQVWSLPRLERVSPGSAGLGLEFDAQIFGSGLRPSAQLSFGDGVTTELGRTDLVSGSGSFFEALVQVASDTAAVDRDLIYQDPDLAETATGSLYLLERALRLFVNVGQLDVDGSGRVDGYDLAAVAAAFGTAEGDPGFVLARDVNNDGAIDGEDLADLAIAFGRSDLGLEPSDLPPAAATLGMDYEHRVRFTGGSFFISDARIIGGDLPDGIALVLDQLVPNPAGVQDFELVLRGIPAEAGSFSVRVQAVDAFFAIVEQDIPVQVNP